MRADDLAKLFDPSQAELAGALHATFVPTICNVGAHCTTPNRSGWPRDHVMRKVRGLLAGKFAHFICFNQLIEVESWPHDDHEHHDLRLTLMTEQQVHDFALACFNHGRKHP